MIETMANLTDNLIEKMENLKEKRKDNLSQAFVNRVDGL